MVDRLPPAPSFPPLLLSLQADEIWMSWQCCRCAAEQAAMAPGRVMDSPDTLAQQGRRRRDSLIHLRALLNLLQPTLSLAASALPGSRPSRALPGSLSQRLVASVICKPLTAACDGEKAFCWQMRDVRPEKGRDPQSEWLSGLEHFQCPTALSTAQLLRGIFYTWEVMYLGGSEPRLWSHAVWIPSSSECPWEKIS